MKDENKTKAQLIKELGSLRQQIALLDQPRDKGKRTKQGAAAEAHLFYSLASIAASQFSDDEILQRCLNIVCEYVGWPVGHLYVEASDGTGELAPTAIWHLDNPENFEVFRTVTERTRFASGVGLPGRVSSSGEPAWIPDVQQDTNFPRNQLAKDIGVRAAFGFPIKIGSKTVAVLEFFTDKSEEPNQHVLDVMRMLGIQFGRVLERRRTEEELQEARDELEKRVAERTAELTQANETLRTEITQRRQDVEEKNKHFAFIENSPDFIALAALDGTLLNVNPAGRELVGLASLEQACSKSIPDYLTEEGLKASLEIEQPAVIAHGQWQGESTLRHFKTGAAIPVEIKSFVIRHPDTNEPMGLATVQHDITDRKRAEEELRQSEEKFRSVFENATEGIFRTTPDGHYLMANPALAAMYGYDSPEELMAVLTDIEHQLYAQPEIRTRFISEICGGASVSRFESQVNRKDGSIIWISEAAQAICDDEGETLYYQGTVTDITERKHAEEQLSRAQEREALHLEQTPLAVIEWNLDFEVAAWNPGAERIFGYSRGEAMGRHASIVVPEHYGAHVDTVWEQLLQQTGGTQSRGRGGETWRRREGSISRFGPSLLTIYQQSAGTNPACGRH